MKKIIRLTVLSAALKVSGIGLTFLFFLVASNLSSDVEYGKFAAIFSLATILGFAFLAGQHLTILRFWPAFDERETRAKADQAARWSVVRVIQTSTLGALIILGIIFLLPALQFTTPEVLQPAGALITLSLAFAFSEFAQSCLRARGEVLVSLSGREVLWRLLSISFLFLIGRTSGVTLIYIASGTLWGVTLLQLWLVYRDIAPPEKLSPQDRRLMMRTSLWLWLSATVGPLSTHSGTIIVGIFLGPTAAGAYFAADRIAKLLSIALIAVNQVVGPVLSREFHAGRLDQVRRLITLSSLISGAICLVGCGAYLIFGRIALVLFSENYSDAFPALMILTAGQAVNTLCGPNTMLMNMAGLERQNTMIMGFWSIAGLAALPMGAMFGGISGTAIAAAFIMAAWNLHIVWKCHAGLSVVPWDIRVLKNRQEQSRVI
ncbi:lipopolysaccharide biosynthesis protein [Palleronia sp.]|uniref:lipopolysaccharide biosynthesis protein n=1 Tax=Palleronia sp. TaxID=1940284 RepID=UPI0035C8001A